MVVYEGRLDIRTAGPDVLADWMQLRGMTVRELSFRTGIPKSTVGDLRSGRQRDLTAANARKIAKALDVPEKQMFTTGLSTVYREVARPA